MDEKMIELPTEEQVCECTEPAEVHTLADDLKLKDELLALIEELKAKSDVLTEKLCIAKDKGLHEQADRCRVLLQRVVLFRNRKVAELKQVEERIRRAQAMEFMDRFSQEVDDITTEIEQELFGIDAEVEEPDQAPLFCAQYDHSAKSRRMSFVSSLFVWVGLLSGLLGAVGYLLLAVFHKTTFSWIEFSMFGALMLVMIVFALIFGAVSNRHKRLAEEIELEIAERQAEYEAACLERDRLLAEARRVSQIEDADGIAEAYAIEKQGDRQRDKKKTMQKLLPDLSDPEKLKESMKKALPIAAACAVVAVALTSVGYTKKKKKKAQAKRDEEMQRELLRLLK